MKVPVGSLWIFGDRVAKVGIKYDDIQVSDVSIIKKYITNMIENPEPQTVVGTAHFSAYIRYDIIYRSLAPFFKSISTPTGLYEFAPYIVEEDNYIYSINGDTLLVFDKGLNLVKVYEVSGATNILSKVYDIGDSYLLVGPAGVCRVDKSTLQSTLCTWFSFPNYGSDMWASIAERDGDHTLHAFSLQPLSQTGVTMPVIVATDSNGNVVLANYYDIQTPSTNHFVQSMSVLQDGYMIAAGDLVLHVSDVSSGAELLDAFYFERNGSIINAEHVLTYNNLRVFVGGTMGENGALIVTDENLNVISAYLFDNVEPYGASVGDGVVYVFGFNYSALGGDDAAIVGIGLDGSVAFARVYSYGGYSLIRPHPYMGGVFGVGFDSNIYKLIVMFDDGTLKTTSDVLIADIANNVNVTDITNEVTVQTVTGTITDLLNEISITHDPISLVDRTADVTITDHTA